jgi:hypothetical protein
MKPNKIKIIFVLLGIFFYILEPAHAQTNNNPKEEKCTSELILGVPKVSEKNLFLLTSTVTKIKGLKYIDFCEKDKLLLLKYDPATFTKQEDIIKAFQAQNIVMPMIIKTGTFEGVKDLCVKKSSN